MSSCVTAENSSNDSQFIHAGREPKSRQDCRTEMHGLDNKRHKHGNTCNFHHYVLL